MTSTDNRSAKIIDLRRLLSERFPQAHQEVRFPDAFETGMEALDRFGLQRGMAVEVVASRPSSGSALLLAGILRQGAAKRRWTALLDGRDSFDPQSLGDNACRWMLWARCRTAAEVTKAADLLLRDGNLPLVVADLRGNPVNEVRRMANPVWHRLRSEAAETGTVLLALTPTVVVGCADLRLEIDGQLTLCALDESESAARASIRLKATRQRRCDPDRTSGGTALRQSAG